MWFRLLFVLLSVVELSKLIAVEIQPDGIYHPFVVSIDRRPQKDVSYGKCIALFWNKDLYDNLLMAASPVGDRECPGQGELKFNYTRNESSERIVGEEGKTISNTVAVSLEEFNKKAHFKGKDWQFSMLPNRITVKVPSHSDPDKLIEDSFCVAYIRNIEETQDKPDRTLLACDDCSTLQKCVDTELPIKKPLSIGGKKVGAIPHKKHRTEEQYVIHETSPAKRREAPAF